MFTIKYLIGLYFNILLYKWKLISKKRVEIRLKTKFFIKSENIEDIEQSYHTVFNLYHIPLKRSFCLIIPKVLSDMELSIHLLNGTIAGKSILFKQKAELLAMQDKIDTFLKRGGEFFNKESSIPQEYIEKLDSMIERCTNFEKLLSDRSKLVDRNISGYLENNQASLSVLELLSTNDLSDTVEVCNNFSVLYKACNDLIEQMNHIQFKFASMNMTTYWTYRDESELYLFKNSRQLSAVFLFKKWVLWRQA